MFYVLLALLALGLWFYCLFDVLTTDELDVRRLPKIVWFLIVLLTMNFGSLAWLLLGRPREAGIGEERRSLGRDSQHRFARTPAPEPPSADLPRGPDDDPDFLKSLDRRIRGED
jgi:hypothetical protein